MPIKSHIALVFEDFTCNNGVNYSKSVKCNIYKTFFNVDSGEPVCAFL